jgi:hypothetical protein
MTNLARLFEFETNNLHLAWRSDSRWTGNNDRTARSRASLGGDFCADTGEPLSDLQWNELEAMRRTGVDVTIVTTILTLYGEKMTADLRGDSVIVSESFSIACMFARAIPFESPAGHSESQRLAMPSPSRSEGFSIVASAAFCREKVSRKAAFSKVEARFARASCCASPCRAREPLAPFPKTLI